MPTYRDTFSQELTTYIQKIHSEVLSHSASLTGLNELHVSLDELQDITKKIVNALPDKMVHSSILRKLEIQEYLAKQIILFLAQENKKKPAFTQHLISFIYRSIHELTAMHFSEKKGQDFTLISPQIPIPNELERLKEYYEKHFKNKKDFTQNQLADFQLMWQKYFQNIISKSKDHKIPKVMLQQLLQAKEYFDQIKSSLPTLEPSVQPLIANYSKEMILITLDSIDKKDLESAKTETSKKQETAYGVTHYQEVGLSFLTDIARNIPASPNKLKFAQKFLKEMFGNMAFNTSSKFMMIEGCPKHIDPIIIRNLNYLTYKSRHLKEFNSIFEKVNKNHNRIINGMVLDDKQKISLKEYSILYDVSRLKEQFDEFNRAGLIESDPELKSLYQKIKKSHEIVSHMEKSFESKASFITLDNTKKKSHVLGKALSFFENLIRKFVTKHGHAAKIYTPLEEKPKPHVSHINPQALDEKFNLRTFLYSDTYQIKLDQLISTEDQKIIRRIFGANWKAEMNQIYKQAELNIHDKTVEKFSGLAARDESAQHKAGLADFFFRGHKQKAKVDFNEIHQNFINGKYKDERAQMLCSEFVALSCISSLKEVERIIRSEAKKRNIHLDPQPIVKIPFDPYEDFSKMHPDRLLRVLQDHHCIEKVKPKLDINKYLTK